MKKRETMDQVVERIAGVLRSGATVRFDPDDNALVFRSRFGTEYGVSVYALDDLDTATIIRDLQRNFHIALVEES